MQCKKNSLVATERDLGAMDDGCRKVFQSPTCTHVGGPDSVGANSVQRPYCLRRAILSSS